MTVELKADSIQIKNECFFPKKIFRTSLDKKSIKLALKYMMVNSTKPVLGPNSMIPYIYGIIQLGPKMDSANLIYSIGNAHKK